MKSFRKFLMMYTLVFLAVMVGMSVLSAFLPIEKSRLMFNSLPACVMWGFGVILLIGSLCCWRSMIDSPGLGLMHLGCLVVLCGGIWGSYSMQSVRRKFTGQDKMTSGIMQLSENLPTSGMFEEDSQSGDHPKADLGFYLRADKLWNEYYPPKQDRWDFTVAFFDEKGLSTAEYPLNDKASEEKLFDEKGIVVRIDDYLTDESIDTPAVLICSQNGDMQICPLDEESATGKANPFKFIRSFENYRLNVDKAGEVVSVDDLGRVRKPVVELEIDGQKAYVALLSVESEMHERGLPLRDGKLWGYVPAPPERYGRVSPPIVKFTATRNGLPQRNIVAARELSSFEQRSLVDLYKNKLAWNNAGRPTLDMRSHQQVKDYFATITVLDNNHKEITQKTIEVNYPLRYGGYHFYLEKMSTSNDERVATIKFHNDAGWDWVLGGFILVLLGVFIRLWARPVLQAIRRTWRAKV